MKLDPLLAIVRYEMKMHRRRRGLFVVLAGLAVVMLWFGATQRASIGDVALWPAEVVRQFSTYALFGVGAMALVVVMLMFPPVLAETIPKDRQVGVGELLDSLPLSPGVRLAGKLLGVWASVLVSFGALALLLGLVWVPLFGTFDLGLYVDLWLAGILPMALWVSGLSTLLPAGQPTRRRATMVGVGLSALLLLAIGNPYPHCPRTWWLALTPAAWPCILTAGGQGARDTGLLSAFPWLLPRLLLVAAAEISLAWVGAWAWMTWRER